jgi:maltooligosyltrehalose trehalohydrolase
MGRFAVDLPFGAQVLNDRLTRFRLWAPQTDVASVEFQERTPILMTAKEDGWFEAEAGCGAGTIYRFLTDAHGAVPDPASRLQLRDAQGWSVVVDPKSYDWRCADWLGRPWEEVVLYEAHVGLMGGFEGVENALPRLADLGATAIELMPIAAFSGLRNWGYDGVLPYAPAASYGSPDDLKALIDHAHELGLMMFLDVVYNHFGPEGNYLPAYAPGFFREDLQTPWGGAIDFRRTEVGAFFTRNALYWLQEYRFDGLRLDAAHEINPPDWLPQLAARVHDGIEPGRHVHLVLENERNTASLIRGDDGAHRFNAQWNDDFHNVLHVLLTGETHSYYQDFADQPAHRLARCLSQGFIYQGEPSPSHHGAPRGEPSGDLAPTAFVGFLQNHDQVGNRAMGERLMLLASTQALRAATALTLLAPHIPLLFMGEEVGSRTPFLYFTDFHDGLAEAVREGRRREFEAFPQFSDAASREQIPDPNALETFALSHPAPAPAPDADAWFAFYKGLLTLRRTRLTPHLKGARALGAEAIGPKAVMAHWRMGDGARLTLAVNLDDRPVALPGAPAAPPIYVTGPRADAPGALAGESLIAWLEAAA